MLKIGTWNSRSIHNKTIILKEIIKEYDILGIAETWMDKDTNIQIRGYNIEREDREDVRRGGGVAIIIKKGISYRRRNNIPKRIGEIELMAVTLLLESEEMDVFMVYKRPPGQTGDGKKWEKLMELKTLMPRIRNGTVEPQTWGV